MPGLPRPLPLVLTSLENGGKKKKIDTTSKPKPGSSGCKRWSDEEHNVLRSEFKDCIESWINKKESKTNPKSNHIERVMKSYKCLKGRTAAQLKTKLNNIKLGKCKI